MASTVFSENLITDPDLLQAVEGEVFARLRASAGPQQTACLDQIALCSIQKDQAIFTWQVCQKIRKRSARCNKPCNARWKRSSTCQRYR